MDEDFTCIVEGKVYRTGLLVGFVIMLIATIFVVAGGFAIGMVFEKTGHF